MQIYVMRHGQAQQSASQDAARALTAIGEKEAQTMGQWLNAEKMNIDHVLVSPYLRAQQTAAIVSKTIAYEKTLQTLDLITPDGNAQQIHDYLDGLLSFNQYKNILIVSHMPVVSYLVGELTTDNQMPLFPTAGVAVIDYKHEQMKGKLVQTESPQKHI